MKARLNSGALARFIMTDTPAARFMREHPDLFETQDWKIWFDLKMKEGEDNGGSAPNGFRYR